MASKIIAVFLVIVCSTYPIPTALGEFIGGIERFDGTVKDLQTWEECVGYGQFSQNDRLELELSPTGLDICDYTTKDIKIGISQIVSVEIHNFQPSTQPFASSFCGLYLTNNSLGTSDKTLWDSEVLGLEYIYFSSDESSIFNSCYGGNGSFSGLVFGADTPPPSYADPYLFTIERLTADSAYCSVHHKNTMELIGSRTLYFSSTGDDLYISLMANVPTTWDNVTIPEPGSICIISLGVIILLRKR